MKVKDQQAYDDWKGKQAGEAYGLACFSYAERWAGMMEQEMGAKPDADFAEMAKRLSHTANEEGITGFMYGAAVSILSRCWVNGEPLRRWHNLETQIGDEGEKANEGSGVLNPALLNLEIGPHGGAMGDTTKAIRVEPDKATLLANRLVRRLVRDGLVTANTPRQMAYEVEAFTEALAAEIHQDIIDGTLRMGT